jgi:hypothetical protein
MAKGGGGFSLVCPLIGDFSNPGSAWLRGMEERKKKSVLRLLVMQTGWLLKVVSRLQRV